jgi:ABC-type Fe3+ transport system substrate-binding protein
VENDTIMEPVKENMIQSMGPMIEQVASYRNYENAIGYSFLVYTTEMAGNDKIKLVSIDGVYPAKDTIKKGAYPFVQMFYAITTGNGTENANNFLKWIVSEQGQYIIEKNRLRSNKIKTNRTAPSVNSPVRRSGNSCVITIYFYIQSLTPTQAPETHPERGP